MRFFSRAIRFFTVAFVICIFASLTFARGGDELTGKQFRAQAWHHMHEVYHGMLTAFQIKPDRFPDLTLELISEYAEPGMYHDVPKLFSLKELRRQGYHLKDDIATILGRYNKREIKAGTTGAKARGELNRIEHIIKEEFYRKLAEPPYNFTPDKIAKVREQLNLLEKITDWTVTCITRKDALDIKEDGPYIGACHLAAWTNAPVWQVVLSTKLEDHIKSEFAYGVRNFVPCTALLTL